MIPTLLSLKNFTSYGADVPPLDFTEFRLACLSGLNGSGKSSVLDAITYAVWGEARGKSPDDLIHLGSLDMEVTFEFLLDESFYRTTRTRNKKKGVSELSLWSKSKDGREWINLSEGTIKDTQLKIEQILKTSYETFANSAFLRQGKADEFTLKGPTERKKILSEVLGLTIYDELEEKAKEQIRDKTQEMIKLETQIGEIENELGQAEIRKSQMEQAQNKVSELEVKLKSIEEIAAALTAEKEILLVEKSGRDQIEKSIQRLKQEIGETSLLLDKKIRIVTLLKNDLGKKDEIIKKYDEYQKLQTENAELSEKQTELMRLINLRESEAQKNQAAKSEHEKLVAQLETRFEEVKREGEKLKKDKAETEAGRTTCPLCGSELNDEHRAQTIQNLDKELQQKRTAWQEINTKLELLKKKEFSSSTLDRILQEIELVKYDEKRHREVKASLSVLTGIEGQKSKLEGAEATLKVETENIKLIESNLESKKKTLSEDQKILSGKEDVSAKLTETQQKLGQHENEKRNLTTEEHQARAVLGEAKGLVSRSEQLGTLREQKIKERDNFSQKKTAYEELALAFGKKGIQAMLIETAIPEIEEETNRLLDRLTDGRMRVVLETQKDTKKGDTVETLDIVLSDELGSRPYEMYSGGEAFRVNFALRLALSRLLTHRAGTKMQFLVIDEGFGTQDAQGREKLVDVINEIKDDFEKILVVTHIEELKDVFPTRIEVEKKSDGSTFRVVGG